jgi:hypothetical protein
VASIAPKGSSSRLVGGTAAATTAGNSFLVFRGGNNSRPIRRAMKLRSRHSLALATGAASYNGPVWRQLVDEADGRANARDATPLPVPASMRSECWCSSVVWKATWRKERSAPPTFRRWHRNPLLRQVYNHLRAIEPLTAKDRLFRALLAYSKAGGKSLESLGVPATFLIQPRSGKSSDDWRGWHEFAQRYEEERLLRSDGASASKGDVSREAGLWLVKPSNANRGIGIEIADSLATARALLAERSTKASMGVQSTWVLQQYIDNPLLLAGRKFDLRVWVLVTDEGDMFVHGPGYVRTSSEPFQMDSLDRQVHLTNYCLQIKHREGSFQRYEPGNTLSWAQLAAYMGQVVSGKRKHYAPAEVPSDAAAPVKGATTPAAHTNTPPCVWGTGGPTFDESSSWPPVTDEASYLLGCEALWGEGGVWKMVVDLVRETGRALRMPTPAASSANGCKEYGFGDRPTPSPRHRFEVLGYDFMITTRLPMTVEADSSVGPPGLEGLGLGIRLIEVNSNPSLSYQCDWHTSLVDVMIHRVLSLTVDAVFGAVPDVAPSAVSAAELADDGEIDVDDEDTASDGETDTPAASGDAPVKPPVEAPVSVVEVNPAAVVTVDVPMYPPKVPPSMYDSSGSGVPWPKASLPTDTAERVALLNQGWVHVLNIHRVTSVFPADRKTLARAAAASSSSSATSPKAASSGETKTTTPKAATSSRVSPKAFSSGEAKTAIPKSGSVSPKHRTTQSRSSSEGDTDAAPQGSLAKTRIAARNETAAKPRPRVSTKALTAKRSAMPRVGGQRPPYREVTAVKPSRPPMHLPVTAPRLSPRVLPSGANVGPELSRSKRILVKRPPRVSVSDPPLTVDEADMVSIVTSIV